MSIATKICLKVLKINKRISCFSHWTMLKYVIVTNKASR